MLQRLFWKLLPKQQRAFLLGRLSVVDRQAVNKSMSALTVLPPAFVKHAVGVPVRKMIIGTVLLSGALAGIAGFNVTAGQEGRLTQSFYQGYG